MKLGVLTNVLGNMPLCEAIKIFKALGVESLEIGCGGYPRKEHCDPEKLLSDEAALKAWQALISDNGMDVSALSVHGNPIHPNKEIAAHFEEDFRAACVLAGQIGVDRIITFSGCPGSDPKAEQPSWVTCAWPNEYLDVLDYQWNEVLIPYWLEAVKFAEQNGVKKIALEMHPGFMVYNPETLMRLRDAVGNLIGANLDPSHLIWQGMDMVEVINYLGDAIYYFHAKDTLMNEHNVRKNGVLDTKPYTDLKGRSWVFRTMGYGNDDIIWKKILSQLMVIGYDDTISIEHEDSLMSPKEGLEKAIAFLKDKIIVEKPGEAWWI